MAKIISIHSFRGGTGKSNTAANISALLAVNGLTVGVVDTDIQSPGIHVLFGFDESSMRLTLNHYLYGSCSITDTAYDVTDNIAANLRGKVYLIPSSIKAGDISHVVRKGFDVRVLIDGFRAIIEALNLDVLLIDTHPGLHKETLLSIAISDVLAIILRPDAQDYQGTAVTMALARQLEVGRIVVIPNKVPQSFDFDEIKQRIEETYNCSVPTVLPHSDELMGLASEGIFVVRYPDDPLTARYHQIMKHLL
jgi:MinD-like ATPase involved in chromosome partitioning or flagellar assembly